MLGEPESWAPPSAAQRLRSSSEAETSSVAALLPSCPGHRSPFPVEGGGGCSDDRGGGGGGPQASLSGGSLSIGLWTLWTGPPHPCVGGVRGWSGEQEVSADGPQGWDSCAGNRAHLSG